ncbi:diadenylate cyclase CdaA [Halobacteriovorax sp. GB3]|uniref:diadenylate cyclase CdaA n=1 Tax=Halobacteriovorax sp. GB3 TaxID=2719615 RepID=UPI0023615669|nr:diadenylate cyclase CdaA [Halobacteriovorax sp. GB3]MDD0853209.1 diadenylate cyclase CdaA [Halobacteriovorax sp. GB3]
MQILDIFVNQMSMKDFVDVFLVAVLLYQILRIVHGTRALQMLMGIVILVGFFFAAQYYKFYSLNWILRHFFDSFFLIFIILFQDQIRSALASVGTGKKFFGFFQRPEAELDIEEIIEVTSAMSRKRIGALIVFERKNGLYDYIATGTKMESHIHSDILYSIFQTKSPLHDGAVIIRGNKIAAAGCFLPLSKNVEIDRHLGTRHRAALGISEVTDAIVVTASEETGRISLCVKGVFYPCENEGHLRQYMKHIWAQEKLSKELAPITSVEKV